MGLIKYPRTPHLPWSEGRTSDDKVLGSVAHFVGKIVVVTEKMDGENTTICGPPFAGRCHARSLDSGPHPSRSWVRALAARVGHDIPENWRVCGENLYAQHSIRYTQLTSYFLMFGIFDQRNCFSWDNTVEWAELLGLRTVPVLYHGMWDEEKIRACQTYSSTMGGVQEGYVVRIADTFSCEKFVQNVAKFVRPHHVQTDEHWMNQPLTPNGLANG